MLDPAIQHFFQERKEGWLKKNIKAAMEDYEKRDLELACDDLFSLAKWLPNAAKRAGQISISTHPCTFSHPSSRKNKNGYASSVIANSGFLEDGFLRSGNVDVAADALGNAAALDVYKLLTTELADGKTLLTHIEQDSEQAKAILTIANPLAEQTYDALKEGFLAMTANGNEVVTSSKIKQVYFPVENDQVSYHQLSILTPSAIVFDLRKRLDNIRFGDEMKVLRENKKKNQEGSDYKEIYNLTTIGYGGTKPQNISVLNNQNGGKAHLFFSMPPTFKKRDIQFPTRDIFGQNIRYGKCRSIFFKLHALYQQDLNNMHIRATRDELYQDLIDYVLETLWQVRSVAGEQFNAEYSQLSKAQRIWLQVTEADDNDLWLDNILKQVSDFIFHGYENVLAKKAIKFGEGEYHHMVSVVEKNKELLR